MLFLLPFRRPIGPQSTVGELCVLPLDDVTAEERGLREDLGLTWDHTANGMWGLEAQVLAPGTFFHILLSPNHRTLMWKVPESSLGQYLWGVGIHKPSGK